MSIADDILRHNERVMHAWRRQGSNCRPFTPSTVPALPAVLSRVIETDEHGGSPIEVPMTEEHKPRGLTPREMEVLRLIVDGMSNKEIARALDRREATVKVHRREIYIKMNAKNAAHAVSIALRTGLVQMEPVSGP